MTDTKKYLLDNLPERTVKPRNLGFTMVMDRGLSLREVEDLIETSGEFIDIVKLDWATSYLFPKLREKLKIYRDAGVPVYFGGLLFEAFVIRNQFEDYCKILDKYDMKYVEISNNSIDLAHDKKCEYIHKLTSQFRVLSDVEISAQDDSKFIPPHRIKQIQTELQAGSWKIIGKTQANEKTGLFGKDGEIHSELVEGILTEISPDKIIWEAPMKTQQVWLIKLLGANVNLGNISPIETVALETMRLGVRSDTFQFFLDPKNHDGNMNFMKSNL